jgi:anti-anti-sigma regulatory factor
MTDNAFPVQWTGRQAVVTLPQCIDDSNTDQVRDQLLWIINRGAAVLIADLTGTVYCAYSGAYALARAEQRANARGAELRLVAAFDVARRVSTFSGPGRPAAVYQDLDRAIAAGAESRTLHGHVD